MKSKNSIGKFIYNLDSRIKLLFYFFSIIIIFLPIDNTGFIFLFVLFSFMSLILRIRPKKILILFFNFILIYIFIQFFNMFFINEPEGINLGIAFKIGNISVYWYSFYFSYLIAFRFFLLLFAGLIFASIIRLDELVFTIRFFLSPLKVLKVNVDDIAIIFTIAIRFLPILKEEVELIFIAQKSRGINLKKNPFLLFKKFKYFSIFVRTLLISSFEKGEHLAIAMENRGFEPGKKRTYFEEHNLIKSDYIFLGFIIIVFLFFVFMAIEGGSLIPRFGDLEFWQKIT